LHSDGDILVPRHFPICLWNLIEENSPRGEACNAKYRLNQTTGRLRAGKLPYLGAFFEQIANRENTHFLPETRVFVHPADRT
jgi:hypothetical protein